MLKIKQKNKASYSHKLRPSQTLTLDGLKTRLRAESTAGKFEALSGRGSWGTSGSPPLPQPSCK